MIILKIYWRLKCYLVRSIYKILYNKKLNLGKKVYFRNKFILVIEKNARVIIGNNCTFNKGCSINALKQINIGENCLFGENVKIYDHNHNFRDHDKIIKKQGYSVSEIHIGKNCWISSNVTILKGVSIGDNVIIGANCLIYRDIESNSVVKNKQELKIEKYI